VESVEQAHGYYDRQMFARDIPEALSGVLDVWPGSPSEPVHDFKCQMVREHASLGFIYLGQA